ncbi:hypothetical protein C9F11_04330 [Streptomyces sp. YIM 121038]|uniref:hypothetical protein n=1 Tax=Streptomyces sp. YIM 121038 TaxID=2136401 RepID=UPI001110D8B6|nr:hypothetical protein [Streptomyces sp. YIM 121038]QCX74569.1 hypothetical protein C9F11_04330 [Streptomyces sp. YIM 121038]
MLFAGASASWRHTGEARVTDAPARILDAVRRRRAWVRARRRAVRIIHDDLGLRPGQGLQELLQAVVRRRRRPLTVLRVPLPPHVSGFCVRGDVEDTIVVTANTSERQGLHVLLHELYHLLCGRPPAPSPYAVAACDPPGLGAVSAQMPSLPPAVVEEVLLRPARPRAGTPVRADAAAPAEQGEDEEWAAEVFATVGLLMLCLDPAVSYTGALTSSFAHRRADV